MISRFAKAFFAVTTILLLLTMIAFVHTRSPSYTVTWKSQLFGDGIAEQSRPLANPASPPSGHGAVIMPKLNNATAKAALGRATWKLMHTVTLRFPEKPTRDERDALSSYFHLTSRLYPCGECAEEFQMLLKKFPPQTSSRRSASLWLCSVHNEVNKRLKKPIFDCAHLDEEYDCGCGGDNTGEGTSTPLETMNRKSNHNEDDITGIEMIKGGR